MNLNDFGCILLFGFGFGVIIGLIFYANNFTDNRFVPLIFGGIFTMLFGVIALLKDMFHLPDPITEQSRSNAE